MLKKTTTKKSTVKKTIKPGSKNSIFRKNNYGIPTVQYSGKGKSRNQITP